MQTVPHVWTGHSERSVSGGSLDRGTNRRPVLVDRRRRWPDVVGKVVGRHAVNALIRHDGYLESYTMLDREPVSFTQQRWQVIELSGACDEPDSIIPYGLQTVEIATRQARKHRIAVVHLRENKAGDEHCTCATGQTTPNAADLPQNAKTGRREATDMVPHRHCSVQYSPRSFFNLSLIHI